MTVFNAFIKVIRKNILTIILYTVILVVFSAANMQVGDTGTQFTASKPEVYIINNDPDSAVTKNLTDYISKNMNIVDIKGGEDAVKDALFYKEISCVVEIPENYGSYITSGKSSQINVRSDETYGAALAKMKLQSYLRVQNGLSGSTADPDALVRMINSALDEETEVVMMTSIDTRAASYTASYFDFAAYSITACIVFIICLVLSSFNELNIRKRTIVSSMKLGKYNRDLLISCCSYALVVYLFFCAIGVILIGNYLFSMRGLVYFINALVFCIATLSMAYFISMLINSKNAVTGIVNVIALGSSFLCGAFVPASMLPDWVLSIAHILPAYWFINSNDRLKEIEVLSTSSLQPVLLNIVVLFGFTIVFFIASVIISAKKRKIV